MTGWDTQDLDGIVEKRRMRGGTRRRPGKSPLTWAGLVVLALLVGVGAYLFWPQGKTGLAALPSQAISSPGYTATVGGSDTITIRLRVHNATDVPVTLVSARILAPTGVTRTALTIIPIGADNDGFDVGDLPPLAPVQLGTDDATRDAIIAARYTVNCKDLLSSDQTVDESIFVTIRVDGQEREEEITSPAVGDEQWLTASAQRVCLSPPATGGSNDQPLPADPGSTATP